MFRHLPAMGRALLERNLNSTRTYIGLSFFEGAKAAGKACFHARIPRGKHSSILTTDLANPLREENTNQPGKAVLKHTCHFQLHNTRVFRSFLKVFKFNCCNKYLPLHFCSFFGLVPTEKKLTQKRFIYNTNKKS